MKYLDALLVESFHLIDLHIGYIQCMRCIYRWCDWWVEWDISVADELVIFGSGGEDEEA